MTTRTEQKEKEYQRKKSWTRKNIDKVRIQKRNWYLKNKKPSTVNNDDNGVTKTCKSCKINMPINLFTKNKNCKNGITGTCKQCINIKNRELNKIKNPSKIRIKKGRDLARLKKYQKEYRIKNKEIINKKTREREYKKRIEDSLYKLRQSLRHRIRQAFKCKKINKNNRTIDVLGIDFKTAMLHIERQFKKGMTWENHGEWHIDHIIPLSSAKTEEELIKLCHYRNLQPLWAEENIKKSNKIPFMQIPLII